MKSMRGQPGLSKNQYLAASRFFSYQRHLLGFSASWVQRERFLPKCSDLDLSCTKHLLLGEDTNSAGDPQRRWSPNSGNHRSGETFALILTNRRNCRSAAHCHAAPFVVERCAVDAEDSHPPTADYRTSFKTRQTLVRAVPDRRDHWRRRVRATAKFGHVLRWCKLVDRIREFKRLAWLLVSCFTRVSCSEGM